MRIFDRFSEDFSLRKKVFIGFCTVSLVPLVLAVIFIYNYSIKELEEDMGSYTVEIAKQVNNRLDTFLTETARVADSIRYNTFIQDFLSIQRFSSDLKDVETILNARSMLDSIGQLYIGLKGIIVVNGYNQLIYSTTERVPDYDYPFDEEVWFHNLNSGLPPFNLSYHPQMYVMGNPVFSYVSSINNLGYSEKGTLIIDYSDQLLADISKGVNLGQTGLVFVLDSEGNFVIPDTRVPEQIKEKIFNIINTDGSPKNHFILKENGTSYLVGFSASEQTGWYSIGLVPFIEVASGVQEMRLIVLLVAVGAVIIIIFLSSYVSKTITYPLLMLEQSMRKVEMGDFGFRLEVKRKDEVGKLSTRFNHMLSELENLTEHIYITRNEKIKLELLNKEVELRSLQSQINPHFLYNTLNTMTCIGIIQKVDEVVDMSNALSNMFKYSTNDKPISSLEEEVTHVKYFMTIMELRYTFPLHFIVDINDKFMETPMLKLIIQPIVENAVYHGIEPKQSEGTIRISAREEGNEFILKVKDEGVGIESVKLHMLNQLLGDQDNNQPIEKHVGIQNV